MPRSSVASSPAPAPSTAALWVSVVADVLMAVGLMLLLGIASGLLWHLGGPTPASGMPVMAGLGLAAVSTGGTAVVLYLLRARASEAEKQASLAAMYRPATWAWAVGAGVVMFVLAQLVSLLSSALVGDVPAPSNLPLLTAALDRQPLLLLGFVAVLAPFYEELLFRRVLFGRLQRAGWFWTGLLLSSALFALCHEIPGVSRPMGWGTVQLWLVYGGVGAVLAYTYQRTGTLLAPILAHGINNALALGLLASGIMTQ